MDEFGITWESKAGRSNTLPRCPTDKMRWGGMVIFDSPESRSVAIDALQDEGYQYFVEYRDAQGWGLSFCLNYGNASCVFKSGGQRGYGRIRPEARDRLPSVQRENRWARRHAAAQATLYRNPAYDLVNEPYFEPPYS